MTPTGDQIDVWLYCGHWLVHVHPPYSTSGDPTVEKYGPPIPPIPGMAGQCFLYFTSNEGAQAFVDICKAFFEGADLYCLQSFSAKNPFPTVKPEHKPSADIAHQLIVAREVKSNLHFAQAGTDRFAAKIGLALAANILGTAYLDHACCRDVRDVLWEQSPDRRDQLRLKAQGIGTRLLSGSLGLGEIMALPNCHTFLVSAHGGAVAVFGFLYGKYEVLSILCDCQDSQWQSALGRDGLVVVVSLRTAKVSAPVPLVEFIAWRGPHRQASAKLDALGIDPRA